MRTKNDRTSDKEKGKRKEKKRKIRGIESHAVGSYFPGFVLNVTPVSIQRFPMATGTYIRRFLRTRVPAGLISLNFSPLHPSMASVEISQICCRKESLSTDIPFHFSNTKHKKHLIV